MSNFQRPRSWFQCFQAYDTSHRLDNSLLQITLNITLRFQHSPCVWIGHIIRVHCWLICVSCFSVIGRVTLYFRDRWPAPRFATCNVFASQYKTCNLNQQILFLRRTCTFHLIAVQNVFVLILIFRAPANFVFTLIEISEPTRINLHVFFLLSQFCCRERKIEGCPCSENLLFHWIPPRLQGEHCGSIFWTLKKKTFILSEVSRLHLPIHVIHWPCQVRNELMSLMHFPLPDLLLPRYPWWGRTHTQFKHDKSDWQRWLFLLTIVSWHYCSGEPTIVTLLNF